jgi:hypothetical protein
MRELDERVGGALKAYGVAMVGTLAFVCVFARKALNGSFLQRLPADVVPVSPEVSTLMLASGILAFGC